jgi:hypothetical protein
MSNVEDLRKALQQKAFYIYHSLKQRKQKSRKDCTHNQCSRWQGVDSDNLVLCDDWNIGFCDSYSEEEGRDCDVLLVPLTDVEAFLADKVIMSRSEYDKQVHVPRKQLEDRFETIKGQEGRAFECFFIKELLEATQK